MRAFEWANATSVDDAVKLLASDGRGDPDELPRPIGGGQDLHTTLKSYIARPTRVVNLKTIGGLDRIAWTPNLGQLLIGSLATISQLATFLDTAERGYAGLGEAARSVATPQIRNLGTVGGNLCQRPRCWYFRLDGVNCLKKGGTECPAKAGENKYHAIMGTDHPCVITHPSDLAPMLVALGASVLVTGPAGERAVKLSEFFTMPDPTNLRRENVLADGEVITQVNVMPPPERSTYVKFKERESLDFAMSSVAAVLRDDGVRLVLGGVAPIPWRCEKAEAFLTGKKLDEATIAEPARLSTDGAKPLAKNGYKVPLTQALVRRALAKLAAA